MVKWAGFLPKGLRNVLCSQWVSLEPWGSPSCAVRLDLAPTPTLPPPAPSPTLSFSRKNGLPVLYPGLQVGRAISCGLWLPWKPDCVAICVQAVSCSTFFSFPLLPFNAASLVIFLCCSSPFFPAFLVVFPLFLWSGSLKFWSVPHAALSVIYSTTPSLMRLKCLVTPWLSFTYRGHTINR